MKVQYKQELLELREAYRRYSPPGLRYGTVYARLSRRHKPWGVHEALTTRSGKRVSKEEALDILADFRLGFSRPALACKYGVSLSTIDRIVTRKGKYSEIPPQLSNKNEH